MITTVRTYADGESLIRYANIHNGRVQYHVQSVTGGWSIGHATAEAAEREERCGK